MVIKKRSVLKKKVGKSFKKKVPKNASSKNSVSRKDFEAFKFGVERLKELKGELDSLDTRGFGSEEQAIRLKLKKVSEIPNIEKELRILKLKINKKYHPKRRKSLVKENLERIKDKIPELKKEIRKLGEKVEESAKKKKVITDAGVGILVDVNFNSFLSDIKRSLSDRIKTKEKEVDDILKTDLQKREEKFREKYVNLIRDFNERKRKAEQQLNERYAIKVKTTLQKEVSEKFNQKLKQKLGSEKVALGKVYKAKLKQHADEELENQKEKIHKRLQEELDKKIEILESQFKKKQIQEEKKEKMIESKLEKEEKALKQEKQNFLLEKQQERKEIREKLVDEFHKKFKTEIVKEEARIRQQLKNEFDLNLKKKIQEHEDQIKKKKLDLELEMQKKIKQVLQ